MFFVCFLAPQTQVPQKSNNLPQNGPEIGRYGASKASKRSVQAVASSSPSMSPWGAVGTPFAPVSLPLGGTLLAQIEYFCFCSIFRGSQEYPTQVGSQPAPHCKHTCVWYLLLAQPNKHSLKHSPTLRHPQRDPPEACPFDNSLTRLA